jgi:hypothetical protein
LTRLAAGLPNEARFQDVCAVSPDGDDIVPFQIAIEPVGTEDSPGVLYVERVQKKSSQCEAVVHDPLGIVGAYSAPRRVRARCSDRVQANRRNLKFRKLSK